MPRRRHGDAPPAQQHGGAAGGGPSGGFGSAKHRTRVSKALTYLLRHGAAKQGLTMSSDGYIAVADVLAQRQLRGVTLDMVREVVATCPKQRFALKAQNDGALLIRANQGHTLKTVCSEELLTPITSASDIPVAVHGTTRAAWASIQTQGLSRMARNHIHFAVGLVGDSDVISGMRGSADVCVFVDTAAAMAAGLRFFRSANNVILSPGDARGFIPPAFFSRVYDRKLRRDIEWRRPQAPAVATAVVAAAAPAATAAPASAAATATATATSVAPPTPPTAVATPAVARAPAVPAPAAPGASGGGGAAWPSLANTAAAPAQRRRRQGRVQHGAMAGVSSRGRPSRWGPPTNATNAGAGAGVGAAAPNTAAPAVAAARTGGDVHMARAGQAHARVAAAPVKVPRLACGARYIVVLDFEATCDEPEQIRPQELIEFPSVVYDTHAGRVVDSIQIYVRPVIHPRLTKFCTTLTGITQATVDAAPTFEKALAAYDKWMREKGYADSCLMVTVGDWDLKTGLPNQVRLHRPALTIPDYLTRWMNVKVCFERLQKRRAGGMASMLRKLNIRLEGKHHSGIDDCRNTMKIVLALLRMRGGPEAFVTTGQLRGNQRGDGGQRGGFASRGAGYRDPRAPRGTVIR